MLCVVLGIAIAAGPAGPLREAEARMLEAKARQADLERVVAEEGGVAGRKRAEDLYEEALYAWLLQDWTSAATGFFVLTSLGTTEGVLLDDSEWYLADSLSQAGFVDMAAAELDAISRDSAHPFRNDALEQLVLLRAEHGPPAAFREAYERALAAERMRTDTRLTYTLGRARYALGELDAAAEVLAGVPETSGWYVRSRYLMAVVDLRSGRVDAAREKLAALDGFTASSSTEAWAQDLARLGVARILLEQGEATEASLWYLRIPDESPVLAEAQEEIAWAWIRSGEHLAALDALERFRRVNPLHPFVGRTRVLSGHVFFVDGLLDAAEETYLRASDDLGGVRERIGGLDLRDEDTKALLEQLDRYEGREDQPPRWALERLVRDGELARALAVERELGRQREELEACQALVAELQSILRSSPVLGRYQQIRRAVDAEIDAMVGLEVVALGLQVERLGRERGPSRRDLADLGAELELADAWSVRVAGQREELTGRVALARAEQRRLRAAVRDGEAVDPAALDSADAAVRALEAERRGPALPASLVADLATARDRLRAQRSLADPALDWSREDGLIADIDRARAAMEALRDRLAIEEERAREPVQALLAGEVGRMERLVADHEAASVRGDGLWERAGQAGIDALVAWLRDSEGAAAAGIADVAWNRLMTLRDAQERDDGARTRDLTETERYWAFIRQRLQ
ncbi:MAG: hypothetical protein H6737_10520 [Alphaproteobacteria bacterium]|nr:hypothetical protein [Alphaproteobacteria bacterium]